MRPIEPRTPATDADPIAADPTDADPAGGDDDPGYDEAFPLWLLVRASHVVGRGFGAVFGSVGLSPAQFGVLAELRDNPAATKAELARIVQVRPQSLGELVGPLLDRGLLHREGPGGRGRAAALTLTPAGRERVEQVLPDVIAYNDLSRLGVSDEDAAAFVRVLRVLATRAGSP